MKKLILLFSAALFFSCNASKQKIPQDDNIAKGQIMFTSKRDGNFEVYLMNDDSTDMKNLTNNGATDYGLNWSANGDYFLFYSDRNGNEDVWQMNSDGTNTINLTNSPSNERAACYSPDGKSIVFISDRDNKTKDLYLMDIDSKNVTRLTSNKNYCESPEWSKEGKYILFTLEVEKEGAEKNYSGEIFSIDIKNGKQTRLTNREGFDSGAAISPDGRKIAFYGKSETGNYDIFIMNIDGSGVINLTDDEMEDYSPSWSSDGHWISFTSGNSKNYDIWKINIVTKEKIRLTAHSKRDETPFYRPN